jgi:uncharacterized GH25 family protein
MISCKSKDGYFRMPELEFKSDAYFFRAVGTAEDASIQTAKSKAVHLAKLEIAKGMGSVMEATVKSYLGVMNDGENRTAFEQISRETVKQALVEVIIKDVVYKQEKNGSYSCRAFVEMPAQTVSGTFSSLGSNSVKLDKEAFGREYNKALTAINK